MHFKYNIITGISNVMKIELSLTKKQHRDHKIKDQYGNHQYQVHYMNIVLLVHSLVFILGSKPLYIHFQHAELE